MTESLEIKLARIVKRAEEETSERDQYIEAVNFGPLHELINDPEVVAWRALMRKVEP